MSALRAGSSHRQSGSIVVSSAYAIWFPSFLTDRNTPACRDRRRKRGVRRRSGAVLGYARCLVRKPEPAEDHHDFPDRRGARASRSSNALETGQFRNKVRSDFMGGVRSGVNATPTFFINGVRHDGAYDYASLVAALQMHTAADTST